MEPSDIVIATTGFTGRELYACDDRHNQLYVVGSMGCASSIGLGLAWARPDRRVVVLDGDGAMLMRLGALATLAYEQPKNLVHVLLDNEAHESTGGQSTVSHSMDLAGVARSCGYADVSKVDTAEDLESRASRSPPGPALRLAEDASRRARRPPPPEGDAARGGRAHSQGARRRDRARRPDGRAVQRIRSRCSTPLTLDLEDVMERAEGARRGARSRATSSSSGASLEERRALAEHLDDPLNRYYRYPAARALLRVAGGLPLRPDHITYIHTTTASLGAAVMAVSTTRTAMVVSFLLLEIRMILDCYDGVLARAKKLSSPRGRTLDELGDAVAYIAICIGMNIHLHRAHPDTPVQLFVLLGMVILAAGAMSGHAYDFYKRRVGSALKDGRDAIAEELDQKHELVRAGTAKWITRFGIWFDRLAGTPLRAALSRRRRRGHGDRPLADDGGSLPHQADRLHILGQRPRNDLSGCPPRPRARGGAHRPHLRNRHVHHCARHHLARARPPRSLMSVGTIDKAIILAAGMGKRIAGVAGTGAQIPKPLLPLDESGNLTFLDWHLRALAAHGAREIYIVGSKATFGTNVAAMAAHPATWIMNDFPGDVSGSGHSTHLAFTSEHTILDGKSRVVLMDAGRRLRPIALRRAREGPARALAHARLRPLPRDGRGSDGLR